MRYRDLAKLASASGAQARLTVTVAREISPGVSVIDTSPGILAEKAGLTVDEYSLARCIASEGYKGEGLARAVALACIGHVVVNEAKARKQSVTRLLTGGSVGFGFYGSQKAKGYAATSRDPSIFDGQVAKAVFGGIPDLTKGARNFVHPNVWGNREKRGETATQAGVPLRTFESVMTSWHKGSAFIGPVPTLDAYRLAFYRPERDAAKRAEAYAAMMAAYRAGMAGKSGPAPGDPDGDAKSRGLVAGLLAAVFGGWYLLRGNS